MTPSFPQQSRWARRSRRRDLSPAERWILNAALARQASRRPGGVTICPECHGDGVVPIWDHVITPLPELAGDPGAVGADGVSSSAALMNPPALGPRKKNRRGYHWRRVEEAGRL